MPQIDSRIRMMAAIIRVKPRVRIVLEVLAEDSAVFPSPDPRKIFLLPPTSTACGNRKSIIAAKIRTSNPSRNKASFGEKSLCRVGIKAKANMLKT